MDTDSAHFLGKHKNLQEPFFSEQFNKLFESGSKMSGIEEGFYEFGKYLAEKC